MIGEEFNALRDTNRALAYRTKQKRINEHFSILTEIMSAKDLNDESRRCEDFMGTEGGGDNGSPLDELSKFLNQTPSSGRVH